MNGNFAKYTAAFSEYPGILQVAEEADTFAAGLIFEQ